MRFATSAVIASACGLGALVTACSPSSSIDFSHWSLQEPIAGSDGNPREISSAQLQNCYHDEWVSTASDGSLVLSVPPRNECVTTPNSLHCRSELREQSPSTWDPTAPTNRLFADVQVTENTGSVCVGQIHIDDNVSHKPVAELYLDSQGNLTLGVNTCITCSQKVSPVATLSSGTPRFTYEIRYEGGKLSVGINGSPQKEFSTFNLNSPSSYFKAGNYNQGTGATQMHIYKLQVSH